MCTCVHCVDCSSTGLVVVFSASEASFEARLAQYNSGITATTQPKEIEAGVGKGLLAVMQRCVHKSTLVNQLYNHFGLKKQSDRTPKKLGEKFDYYSFNPFIIFAIYQGISERLNSIAFVNKWTDAQRIDLYMQLETVHGLLCAQLMEEPFPHRMYVYVL